MIFVTVGSQKFQFDRLLKYIDELIKKNIIKESVFAQIGYSKYIPQNFEYKNFLTREEFQEKISLSRIVITHAGTGAIVTALKKEKKVIAIPRLMEFGEHVDDHQKEIAKSFVSKNYIFESSCEKELISALQMIENFRFEKFHSQNDSYIEFLKKYLLN